MKENEKPPGKTTLPPKVTAMLVSATAEGDDESTVTVVLHKHKPSAWETLFFALLCLAAAAAASYLYTQTPQLPDLRATPPQKPAAAKR
ncbi:MAG: hypothetical protein LBD01_03400 [Puniceicoccales bacterium]|jgi:hypothetical protein|nr:hypothetical protein [Puniceicoccales bacterium]